MLEAQRLTDRLVFPPGDHTMRLNPAPGVPYTARCNFKAGEMDLNPDLQFTRSAIKHLMYHEVFPDHSTQLLYALERARTGGPSSRVTDDRLPELAILVVEEARRLSIAIRVR